MDRLNNIILHERNRILLLKLVLKPTLVHAYQDMRDLYHVV